ncbi:MAG: polymer-forming cytoskeletal protein [Nitrospirae bacterium]|nr:MAG: polymer-forming cytoskeletal protein [Nitrospirota bacterium]
MFTGKDKKKELPQEGKETFTFLARGFEFKGTLTFEGTVRIDGSVAGEIRSNGTIILGEHAAVEGDVSAGTIVSGGKITGNVMATEKVHLLPTAMLRGDVMAPLVQMDEGVSFHGTCESEGRVKKKAPEEVREMPSQVPKVRVSHRGEAL